MKKDLTVGRGSGWMDAVVMRFDVGGLNEEGWEQRVWLLSGHCTLKIRGDNPDLPLHECDANLGVSR